MTDSSTKSTMTLSEAREEVKKCDQEIQSIKAALRGIGNANSSEPNSLEIEFIKVRTYSSRIQYNTIQYVLSLRFVSFRSAYSRKVLFYHVMPCHVSACQNMYKLCLGG